MTTLPRLPRPTGPYGVGTTVRHMVDPTRTDIFQAGGGKARDLMVQIWYPAWTHAGNGKAEPSRARYVDDGRLLQPLAELMGLPTNSFDDLDKVETHALIDVPVADEVSFPVLLFSHGRCGFRGHNTVLVEELVSRGYIVAAIDHPGASTGVKLPDRTQMFDRRLLPPWPRRVAPGLDATFQAQILPFLAKDLPFVIDELMRLNTHDPKGILTGRLDTLRIGAMGVSLGGMLVGEASASDSRIDASVIMDVYLPQDVVDAGLKKPTLWLTRDAGTMCLEGWERADIDDTHNSMRSVFERLPGAGYIVRVPGMYHVDFSDGRLLSPLIAEKGISGTVPLERSLGVVADYTVSFFDRELKQRRPRLLEALRSTDPDVLFERRINDEKPELDLTTSDQEAFSARA